MFLDEKLLQIEAEKKKRETQEKRLQEIREDILRQEQEQKSVEDWIIELKHKTVEIDGQHFICEKKSVLNHHASVFVFPEEVDRIFEENNVVTVFYRTMEIGTNLTFLNQPAATKDEADFQEKITKQYANNKLTYQPLETGNLRSGGYRVCYAEGILNSAVGGIFVNNFYCSGKKRTITGNYTCLLLKRYFFGNLFRAMISLMFETS